MQTIFKIIALKRSDNIGPLEWIEISKFSSLIEAMDYYHHCLDMNRYLEDPNQFQLIQVLVGK